MIRGRGGRGEVGKNRDESWRNLRIYESQQTDIFLFRSEERLIDRFLETEGRSAPAPLPLRFLSTLFRLFGSFHGEGRKVGGETRAGEIGRLKGRFIYVFKNSINLIC